MLKYSMDQATTLSWPFDRDIRYYAEQGIPAVGIQRRKLEDYGVDKGIRLLRDAGMDVSCMLSTGFFSLDDDEQWPGQIEEAKRAIALAARVEADCLVLLSGGCGALSYEEAEARFLDILGRLLPEAERMGQRLALEPNNCLRVDLGYIHTLHDALDLADLVDSPFFTVCFETNNAWIERRLYENIRRRTGRIGLVQINDFRAGTTCTPSRAPLGDGIIPLERILNSFEEAGYDGYYDIELVGPEIEEMGYEQAVARSLEFLRRLSVG
ncbi:MAG: sugar phosphate isomerase/epimerase [Chloroflexi bacterium]|nr:sugar phosphate isomerase/epimerase [Chloroflexota bacterium]